MHRCALRLRCSVVSVAVLGLAVGAAVFVFVDRYPRLPQSR